MKPTSNSSQARGIPRVDRRRKGPIVKALGESLREARDAGRIAGSAVALAALAEQMAHVVDAAFRAQDLKLALAASSRLEQLIRKLPIDEISAGGDDDDGGDSGGFDLDAELAALLGSGPEGGDAADA